MSETQKPELELHQTWMIRKRLILLTQFIVHTNHPLRNVLLDRIKVAGRWSSVRHKLTWIHIIQQMKLLQGMLSNEELDNLIDDYINHWNETMGIDILLPEWIVDFLLNDVREFLVE